MTSRHSLQSPAYASTSASSSSLSQTSLPVLADPPTRFADGAALDYLIIEMTHTLRASASVAAARVKKLEREMIEAGLMPEPPDKATLAKEKEKERIKKEQRESTGSMGTRPSSTGLSSGGGKGADVDEEDEGLRLRLEAIGMHIGGNVTERLCRDRPRFGDTLDAVKFVCKDVWSTCWDKQVDNLRTNHRGVYVLQDNQFKPIMRISSYEGTLDALRRARVYVAMPVGIIKGALARMGYQATVTPEIVQLPQCTFQVKLPRGT